MASIIGLIASIVGCALMGFSSSVMTGTIAIALILTLLGFGLTMYSLIKQDYNKICVVISFILCIISIIMRVLLAN